LTYGDGVSDININELVHFHNKSGRFATMTAIQPGGRFGVLEIEENYRIKKFTEKSKEDGGWINGGFMVLEPEIFNYLSDDPNLTFELEPLETMAHDGQLSAYKYSGFWQCMDTLRDQMFLNKLIEENKAPWIKWE
jgi:glucose-1-phosphate cytidylyltransferase